MIIPLELRQEFLSYWERIWTYRNALCCLSLCFRTIALQSFILADFVYQFVRTLEIKGIKKGATLSIADRLLYLMRNLSLIFALHNNNICTRTRAWSMASFSFWQRRLKARTLKSWNKTICAICGAFVCKNAIYAWQNDCFYCDFLSFGCCNGIKG